MSARCQFWVIILLTVSVLPIDDVAADSRDDIAQVVRLLGYGGGIHNFKNYVLRGREEYHAAASQDFNEALSRLEGLKGLAEFSTQEQAAIDDVRVTIDAYRRGLDKITELRTKDWRLEDIDLVVVVDDTAAISALDLLRSKWQWNDLEEMEFQLGYGKGIHNFKNYVLRGQERYHTEALENFLAAESLITSQLAAPGLSDRREAALQTVNRVTRAYREYLPLIERLLAMMRNVEQLDLAVKVNDLPAFDALELLR